MYQIAQNHRARKSHIQTKFQMLTFSSEFTFVTILNALTGKENTSINNIFIDV